ncbi:MAG: aminoacetone oxidase family FAD-binding enzyme [Chlorobiaceae bacterium]|nr:aminoacetone oxidase family FAD-binding enzyme [Chlorobiaceae bacterium]NTV61629.1 aminoacetone oxidase family FAD-binding enzyme [Chlorobiaceae bacterium]
MAAAISASMAAKNGRAAWRVVLLEKNDRTGAKIRISGGGKCNVTHSGQPGELLEKGFLRRNEQRFLRQSIFGFTGADLLAMLREQGVETEARADGNIFPSSGNAMSVVRVFDGLIGQHGVDLHVSCRVKIVRKSAEGFFVETETCGTFEADALILATGGVSYARTGTSGDGLSIARKLGHSIVTPAPALAPVYSMQPFPGELSGISLRQAKLIASSGTQNAECQGDILFTHKGFSGPAVLSLSRYIAEFSAAGETRLFADLLPHQGREELEKILLFQATENGKRLVRKFLQSCPVAPPAGSFSIGAHGTLPTAIVPYILRFSGIGENITWGGLTRDMRKSLQSVLKRFPLGIVRKVPLDEGEVSAGGVSLCEINPKTMESRIVPGLFICGELLDYAGEVGGYNLQAAFSTGWNAGRNAVRMTQPAQE